ncbi:TetR/AcrR family transcriptional regulator [Sphingosinicella microcystinivorans]|uniref:TetR family transcriptional regulator n=1 Tax=Sphingosinicella microcystinivorans TaxID=335406 RepID=A0ABX9SZC3_SPHMI|nr:TetR/AcrR family transcriptional regulator [Sphingosinicella microcystinivorans]RKS89267.1 TetR family transcriptional regulator [Sphingosinicella microcystinivorans]
MKDALLQAAKDLLWEDGYGRMSPARVLSVSGAGQGSLYHHFSGKAGLAKAAIEEIEIELSDAARAVFDPSTPPLDRLRAYLLAERNGLKGCRLGRLANEAEVLASPDLSAPIARYFTLVQLCIATALEEAMSAGQIDRRIDAYATAAMLLAVVQGGYVISRASDRGEQIVSATNAAWAMLKLLQKAPNGPKKSES